MPLLRYTSYNNISLLLYGTVNIYKALAIFALDNQNGLIVKFIIMRKKNRKVIAPGANCSFQKVVWVLTIRVEEGAIPGTTPTKHFLQLPQLEVK